MIWWGMDKLPLQANRYFSLPKKRSPVRKCRVFVFVILISMEKRVFN